MRCLLTIGYLCISVLFLQCSTTKRPSIFNLEGERLSVVEQQLRDQAEQIKVLEADLHKLRTKASERGLRQPSIKLRPKADEKIADLQWEDKDEVISDSRHESMFLYSQGLRCLKANQLDKAVSHFSNFLKLEPEHVYADRARYLIAEAHYLNGEYGLMLNECRVLETRYPQSFRVPDCQLKRALGFIKLNKKEVAKSILRDLISKFPREAVSKEARAVLVSLIVPPLLDE